MKTIDSFWLDLYRPYFEKKKILIGITGSIAAVKCLELLRVLKNLNATVRVVLTESGSKFLTPLSIETITGERCLTSMWDDAHGTHHIDLARWADVILVAPATANTIAKIANGMADDLLSTEILAFQGPVFIVPAMNPVMWSNSATRDNVGRLRNRREIQILGPVFGATSCGEEGEGRMLEVQEIIENMTSALGASSNGKTALVSLGPTRSYLDPIRYITNRSSGKMGAALAFALSRRGYHVKIVHGPTQSPLPKLAHIVQVESTDDMAGEILNSFSECDLFVSTAAVLDFEFAETHKHKVKKAADEKASSKYDLRPTIDILTEAGKMKKKQFILGFAAETENLEKNARTKMKKKNCDAVFVNPISDSNAGFESLTNEGLLITSKKSFSLNNKSKAKLADEILDTLKL